MMHARSVIAMSTIIDELVIDENRPPNQVGNKANPPVVHLDVLRQWQYRDKKISPDGHAATYVGIFQ